MTDFGFPSQPSQFSRTLRDCRELYVSSGQLCAREFPHLISRSGEEFIQLMDDLHRALVLKVYFSISEADRQWSKQERFLAEVLFHHLWDQWLAGEQLTTAARRAAQESINLKWYSLVRPFDRIAPLRERVGELETVVMRLANLVARADGRLHPKEADAIRSLQEELHQHLRAVPIDAPDQHVEADAQGSQAIEQLRREADDVYSATRAGAKATQSKVQTEVEVARPDAMVAMPELSLEDALAELDALIGLERVKHEVRTLTNFLKLQQRRRDAGLPETEISLHMVFHGNPGTGKTTVARIVGKIFGAMGILAKGHLVETDRSGLVAEYAGQTGPKTNAKVDEALDGVLFIDEAYSLIAEGEDPFGREAVQALLKRIEDQRQRLVVVFAGYPEEMRTLLRSNPGLSSRFSRQLSFDDYLPLEMARIFGLMCGKNHYELTSAARLELLQGLSWWYDHRDRHFGNGRAVRNLFEHAIRRLANRLATIEELSADQLSLLEADDIEFSDVPAEVFASETDGAARVHVACPSCDHANDVPGGYLGRQLQCPKCKKGFTAEWGELVE
jgi:hypothetical protein